MDRKTSPLPAGDVLLGAALDVARQGISVFPLYEAREDGSCACGSDACPSAGKHPRVKWRDAATVDERTIRRWWTRWPNANVGGAGGDLFCLDIDPGNGGFASLYALEAEHGKLPTTATVLTGEKDGVRGRHYWYLAPNGARVGTGAGLRPGLDVRGAGGYAVLPPSIHASGARYEWETPLDSIATAPAWLVELAPERSRPSHPDWVPSGIAPSRDVRAWLDEGEWPIGEQRTRALRCARSLLGGGMPREEVVEHVWDALQRSDWDPTKGEWTREQIEQLVADLERNPPAPLASAARPYTHTDDGNAQRFADHYWETIRWVPEWKMWVFWRGDRWTPDAPEFATQQMLEIGRAILRAAAEIEDDDARKRELRWGHSSLSDQRVRAALALAKAQLGLIARPGDFDGDPWLLNCHNGTLDLRTGELREHRREDMLLEQTACEYHADARSEDWNRVLRDSFESAPELVEYLQKVFGYALTGDTSEEKFFFFFGKSGAGKGTILESFGGMLGSYTRSMNYRTLTSGSHQSGSGPTEDVARLHRARFVVASEFEKNQPLAEAFVSTLTGRDTITARFLHQGSFEFRPELTLFLSANHKPKLSGSPESGVWRRLQVVTFDHKVQQVDKKLKSRLGTPEARAATLAWAVAGCLRWQAEGLGEVPQSMQDALTEYQAESDPYSQFLRDTTVESPGSSITKEDLFGAYIVWADANGISRTTTKQTLGKILKERGVDEGTQDTKREDGKRSSQRVWRGIALKPLGPRLLGAEDAG